MFSLCVSCVYIAGRMRNDCLDNTPEKKIVIIFTRQRETKGKETTWAETHSQVHVYSHLIFLAQIRVWFHSWMWKMQRWAYLQQMQTNFYPCGVRKEQKEDHKVQPLLSSRLQCHIYKGISEDLC